MAHSKRDSRHSQSIVEKTSEGKFEIFDFALTEEEMKKLDSLNISKRYCRPDDPAFSY